MKRNEVIKGLKVRRIKPFLTPEDADMSIGFIYDDKIIDEGTSGKVIVEYRNGIKRPTPLNQLRIRECE